MTGGSESLSAAAWPVEGLRAIVGTRPRPGDHDPLAAPARHPPRLGHGRCSADCSDGASPAWSRSGSPRWDWGSRRLGPAHPRHRCAGDDGRRRRVRPPGPSRIVGDRRAGRTRRSLPIRYAPCSRGSPSCAATGSSSAWLARRASGRFSPAPIAADGRSTARPIRLRRVLEEAGGVYVKLGQIAATRVDLLPADVCAELATLQNQVPPEPREGIAVGARRRARRRRRPRVRRVRVGAAGGGIDRSDPSRPPALGRGGGRQDPATRHRGHDGARPRGTGAAGEPRPTAHFVRQRRALRRTARAVRARACAPSWTFGARPTR